LKTTKKGHCKIINTNEFVKNIETQFFTKHTKKYFKKLVEKFGQFKKKVHFCNPKNEVIVLRLTPREASLLWEENKFIEKI
jgi:hypothetical protein